MTDTSVPDGDSGGVDSNATPGNSSTPTAPHQSIPDSGYNDTKVQVKNVENAPVDKPSSSSRNLFAGKTEDLLKFTLIISLFWGAGNALNEFS
jgi:hypothetical protein